MTKLACDSKSSSCHSLSLWQCLVVYLLEFKIIIIDKTLEILNKFTIPRGHVQNPPDQNQPSKIRELLTDRA